MASGPGKHLLRAKSTTEKLGLFLFILAFFLSAVWLPHGQLLAIIEETVSLT